MDRTSGPFFRKKNFACIIDTSGFLAAYRGRHSLRPRKGRASAQGVWEALVGQDPP